MRNFVVLLSLCCLALFTGCQANDKNLASKEEVVKTFTSTEVPNSEETPKVVGFSGKLAKTYDTLDSLQKDSSLIIEGEVIANEYIVFEGITFTISIMKVNDVVKGNTIKKGETVKVLQTGGISSISDIPEKDFENKEERERFLKKNKGKKIELVFEESPVIKEQQNAVLFLTEYEGPIGKNLYVGTGDFQGRFIVNKDIVKTQNKFLKEQYKQNKEEFKNFVRTLSTK